MVSGSFCAILISMEPVKLLKNYISNEDAQSIIDYIDKNQNSFTTGPKKLKFTKKFGKDNVHKLSQEIVSGIDEIDKEIKSIVSLAKESISDHFQDTEDFYLSGIWLTKQLPGAEVVIHQDTDGGNNNHLVYSAILYLSNNHKSSPLEFSLLNLSIVPELGDLVIFRSCEVHEVKAIDEERYAIPMWFTTDKNYELKFAEK